MLDIEGSDPIFVFSVGEMGFESVSLASAQPVTHIYPGEWIRTDGSSRLGYASIREVGSGFRYINGFVGSETKSSSGLPVKPNISPGDSVAGLHAAFGTVSVSNSIVVVVLDRA